MFRGVQKFTSKSILSTCSILICLPTQICISGFCIPSSDGDLPGTPPDCTASTNSCKSLAQSDGSLKTRAALNGFADVPYPRSRMGHCFLMMPLEQEQTITSIKKTYLWRLQVIGNSLIVCFHWKFVGGIKHSAAQTHIGITFIYFPFPKRCRSWTGIGQLFCCSYFLKSIQPGNLLHISFPKQQHWTGSQARNQRLHWSVTQNHLNQ